MNILNVNNVDDDDNDSWNSARGKAQVADFSQSINAEKKAMGMQKSNHSRHSN